MVTVISRTIGGLGGEYYSTIASWESDAPANLVTSDQLWEGKITDTRNENVQTIAGSISDATRYKHLTADAGAEFDPAGSGGSGTGARIQSSGNATLLTMGEHYARLSKLGLINTYTGTSFKTCLKFGSAATCISLKIDSCVFVGPGGSNSSNLGMYFNGQRGFQVTNCIFVGDATTSSGLAGGIYGYGTTTPFKIYNCVAYNFNRIAFTTSSASYSNGYGFRITNAVSGSELKNCISTNNNAQDFNLHANVTKDYNCSEDSTAAGSNSITGQVATDLFTDPANNDFSLKAGSNAIDDGVDLSATFTTDFSGATHGSSGTWEMGAYDFAAGGSPTTLSPTVLEATITFTAANVNQIIKVSVLAESSSIQSVSISRICSADALAVSVAINQAQINQLIAVNSLAESPSIPSVNVSRLYSANALAISTAINQAQINQLILASSLAGSASISSVNISRLYSADYLAISTAINQAQIDQTIIVSSLAGSPSVPSVNVSRLYSTNALDIAAAINQAKINQLITANALAGSSSIPSISISRSCYANALAVSAAISQAKINQLIVVNPLVRSSSVQSVNISRLYSADALAIATVINQAQINQLINVNALARSSSIPSVNISRLYSADALSIASAINQAQINLAIAANSLSVTPIISQAQANLAIYPSILLGSVTITDPTVGFFFYPSVVSPSVVLNDVLIGRVIKPSPYDSIPGFPSVKPNQIIGVGSISSEAVFPDIGTQLLLNLKPSSLLREFVLPVTTVDLSLLLGIDPLLMNLVLPDIKANMTITPPPYTAAANFENIQDVVKRLYLYPGALDSYTDMLMVNVILEEIIQISPASIQLDASIPMVDIVLRDVAYIRPGSILIDASILPVKITGRFGASDEDLYNGGEVPIKLDVRQITPFRTALTWSHYKPFETIAKHYIVQRSECSDAGFVDISEPIAASLDPISFIDNNLPNDSRLPTFYYRVVMKSRSGTSLDISSVEYAREARSKIGLEIVRRINLLLKRYVGRKAFLFVKKTHGVRCPNCWDSVKERRVRSQCIECNDTGFKSGYCAGIPILVSDRSPEKTKTPDLLGSHEEINANFFTSNFPVMKPGDIFYLEDGMFYRVDKMRPILFRETLVQQEFQAASIEKDRIINKLSIPDFNEFDEMDLIHRQYGGMSLDTTDNVEGRKVQQGEWYIHPEGYVK